MNQDNGGVIGKINTPTTSVASGVWSIEQQFEAQSSSIWPLAFPQITIANSCRFNDDSSDYLSRTPSGAGNRKTFTISAWIKRGQVTTLSNIMSAWSSNADSGHFLLRFDSAERLDVSTYSTNVLTTTRVFRDSSAWYNIVCAVDTTSGTADQRVRLYVNGVEETNFSTRNNPSQSADLEINNSSIQVIGANYYSSSAQSYSDGYLAEFVLIDGQQLTPTSFGAFNPVTNIWEPRGYAGTYGTNGFKLNFSDSSALGDDTSGNGNDFTANNLTSIDQSTDTPSNNFATMNPLYKLSNVTFSEGNLQHTNAGNWQPGLSTIGVSSGKWYFESKFTAVTGGSNNAFIGISLDTEADGLTLVGNSANSYGYENTGQKKNNTSSASYGDSWTVGDIVSCYVDLDNGAIYFGKNGTVQASGDPTSGSAKTNAAYTFTTGGTYLLGVSDYYGTQQINYGSPPFSISSGNADANGHGNFEYAVPSGYFALNTKNLSEFG